MAKNVKKYRTACICLALAVATLAVFWQVRGHEFVDFDDNLYVYDNDHVKAGLTREGLVWAFTQAHAYNWHPLTWLSHMLDCEIYGLDSGRHHLTNVLFHILSAILLLLVLNRMTGNLWLSAFVAAAFALHPLHVESVAWVSERKDVLSTFLWMLTMWAYVRYVERPSVIRYLMMLLFFGLGLTAKQMLVTLPFVLLLLDYWPLRRLRLKGQGYGDSSPAIVPASARRCVLEKIPLVVLAALAGVIVYVVQQQAGLVKSLTKYSPAYRLANAAVTYVAYLGKMFWPTNLAAFYPHADTSLPVWQIIAATLVLVGITAVAIRSLYRRPYLAVGWLWYLGTLVPVIGLVQVGLQARADRYTYIPLTGLFIMIAWLIRDVFARLAYPKAVLSISAAIVLLLLGVTSWSQVGYWRDSIALYERATAAVPNNRRAYVCLAETHLSRRDFGEAIVNFNKALRIKPDYIEARCGVGRALVMQGRAGEAAIHFAKALEFNPNYDLAHTYLGAALAEQGKSDEAYFHLSEAIRINPRSSLALRNMGIWFFRQGRFDEAAVSFREALRVEPDDALAAKYLQTALQERERSLRTSRSSPSDG
ncbi:MAG: tetratricopeptide repeat protein [Phycisphaerales bacterium]|nr:MAG: tetratricopeptide repeat protein [Phycisphaerales bacterium]